MNKTNRTSTPSSGNVFADLELDQADVLLARAELGFAVRKLIEARGFATQKEIATLLGIQQPEVSNILNSKYHLFSEARLLTFLTRLDQKIHITISPRSAGEAAFAVHL